MYIIEIQNNLINAYRSENISGGFMLDLIVKIKTSLKLIEQEKGDFKVKYLVAKDLSNLQWDLVLSADWFDSDMFKRLDYLSKKILSDFDIDCMMQFSGIVTYESIYPTPLLSC